MISNVSSLNVLKTSNCNPQSTPAFGMAAPTKKGLKLLQEQGMQFVKHQNNSMYAKQGLLQKSAIAKELASGELFTDLCKVYGCSGDALRNADFIKFQILTKKGQKAVKKVSEDVLKQGRLDLLDNNFLNKYLSRKKTRALLDLCRPYMESDRYAQLIGYLQMYTK
ncbi:MAG: hypothetical protein E7Z90_05105 [Cyanobacteria bacterium SIG29]|nr:hypothetical protein [Cyanobacteria bacterium SIG29]